jgi:hypothetical protein
VQVSSPALGRLRQNCAESLQADIGHAGSGHISLAYVIAEYFEQARDFVELHKGVFQGFTFPLSSIEIRHPDGVTARNIPTPYIAPASDRQMSSSSAMIEAEESEQCLSDAEQQLTQVASFKHAPSEALRTIHSIYIFLFVGKYRSRLLLSSTADAGIRLIGGTKADSDISLYDGIKRLFLAQVGIDLSGMTLEDFQCYMWADSTAVYVASTTDHIPLPSNVTPLGLQPVLYPLDRLRADLRVSTASNMTRICQAMMTSLESRFRAHSEVVDAKVGVVHYTLDNYFGALSCEDVLRLWTQGDQKSYFTSFWTDLLLGAARQHKAYFWECAPMQSHAMTAPFEFVIVPTNPGRFAPTNWRQFEDKFSSCSAGQLVATFPNPRGDAVLVSPIPQGGGETYGHLAQFLENASNRGVVDSLWCAVGFALQSFLSERGLVWLSTSGLGVPWLHVRLDTNPKYYEYQPYRSSTRKYDA